MMLNCVESIRAYIILKDYVQIYVSLGEPYHFNSRQKDADDRIYEEIHVVYFDKHKNPLVEEDLFENFQHFGFVLHSTTPDNGVFLRRYVN